MEKFEQAMAILGLTMGLCIMWLGYSDLFEASPAITAPARHAGAAHLSGFDISSATVSGGNSIQARLTFSDFTPMEGAVVEMTSTDPSAVTVSDVAVPAASKAWNFRILTNPIHKAGNVIVTARHRGITKSVMVKVQQLSPVRAK
jgi:hypothetical protein